MEQDDVERGDSVGEGALPDPPEVAAAIFGDRLPMAQLYARSLATDAMVRGLIGPREVTRLWDRHILNSAVLAELLEPDETLVDIGSGAGLPGIPVAIARPDVTVLLVEPLLRRTVYLEQFCGELLPNVRVIRGRAEDPAVIASAGGADAVTSRAVSSFPKLAPWSAALLRDGGRLLAVKGSRADDEIAQHAAVLRRAGLRDPEVVQCGVGVLDPPTTVVRATRHVPATKDRRRGGDRKH